MEIFQSLYHTCIDLCDQPGNESFYEFIYIRVHACMQIYAHLYVSYLYANVPVVDYHSTRQTLVLCYHRAQGMYMGLRVCVWVCVCVYKSRIEARYLPGRTTSEAGSIKEVGSKPLLTWYTQNSQVCTP
jgi:hypothetical protein